MTDIMYFSIIFFSLSFSRYIFQGGLVYAKREIAPKDAKKKRAYRAVQRLSCATAGRH